MKFSKKFKIGSIMLWSKWRNKKRPLAVGWSLTKRCSYACLYCGSNRRIGNEMNDEQLMLLAQQIVDAGVLKVSFTGGEPLLREKIVDLVPFLADHNVSVTIDTNGKLLPKMIDRLTGLDGVLLSLDGPEKINDEIRAKGAYNQTIEALALAKDRGLRAVLTCVLSLWNLDSYKHVLEVAEKYHTSVQFQPATGTLLGVTEKNPGVPDPVKFKEAIEQITRYKKGIYKNEVGNSISGLQHLSRWPDPNPVRCISGLVSCRIEPDGIMYHCGRVIASSSEPPNVLDSGFREAFEKLMPFDCPDCWCAQRVELLLASEVNLDVIRNMISIY